MDYRNTASYGKRQEYVTIAELLKRGFDVYQTLVDDQQIDCVIRLQEGNRLTYLDIQIKARSPQAKPESWGTWPSLKLLEPRENFFFIFYSEPMEESYWIIPSLEIVKHARKINFKDGKQEGVYGLTLAKWTKKEPHIKYVSEFEEYRNNFDVLKS